MQKIEFFNEGIEKASELEAKIFELIKQESPESYNSDIVRKALALLENRLFYIAEY